RRDGLWGGFVGRRGVWGMGSGMVFHGPEMFQDRNPHNLLRDFEQEGAGYLGNEKIRRDLEALPLDADHAAAGDNCLRCYEALVGASLVPAGELPLLRAWLEDLARVR